MSSHTSLAPWLEPWSSQVPPLYDTAQTWESNLEKGPLFSGPFPPRKKSPPSQWIDFLGYPIASPLGVAAGPLLDGRWTQLASALGFDVITYKTISYKSRKSHPLPNILPLDSPSLSSPLPTAYVSKHPPQTLQELTITNSFGNPSKDPDYLMADLNRARQNLEPGQVLVVSLFGWEEEEQDWLSSYCRAAALAKEAQAPIVEANLSCPNLGTQNRPLYLDAVEVERLCHKLVQVLGPIPLIIKVGTFSSSAQMKATLMAAARGGARAISGINTLSARISTPDGRPALGPLRPTGGVCGSGILELSQQFVRQGKEIIDQEALDLQLIGVGGVMTPQDAHTLLDCGAQCVQVATAMMWDPYLAARFHQTVSSSLQAHHQG